jgi:hypothetical protein
MTRTNVKVVFLALTAAVFTAWAQFDTGTILGTVTDPSGAAIPHAKVTAREVTTDEVRTFETDLSGGYRFNALPRGTYRIDVNAPGFAASQVDRVTLGVTSQVRVDFAMQVGQATQTVEVAANAQQLQTNTATVGTVIPNTFVAELPYNGRNLFDVVSLSPGVVKVTGSSSVLNSQSVEISGVRNTSTNTLLDGVDFTVMNVNSPAVALSLDTIEEFKVQMNFMDASYGHGAAGIEMVSKRGTNSFHGAAYDFLRNRALQAGNFFRPATGNPRFTYNQFGVAVGGPIRKDKTFIFGNYEGKRDSTGDIYQGLVPDNLMKTGNFTDAGVTIKDPLNGNAPFPGDIIPQTRVDPLAAALLQYFPTANITRPGVNYLYTPSDHERRDQFTVRVDHEFSSNTHLFGRYTFADDMLLNAAYRVGLGLIRPDKTQVPVVGLTHVFSPTLISETRLNFFKAYLARIPDGGASSTNYAAQLGLQNLDPLPGYYALPNLSFTGYTTGGNSNATGFVGYGCCATQNNIYYRAGETLTWIKGSHNIRFGTDINRVMVGYNLQNDEDGVFSFSGNFSGNSFADYLLGYAQSATGGVGGLGNFGGAAKYAIGTISQSYVQDDWKVNDRLTLNIGLRYEIMLPWRGRLANFDLATGRSLLTVSPDYYIPGQGLIQGSGQPLLPERPEQLDANNFAPRLGLAYRLSDKTVIRAGGGVFYSLNSAGTDLGAIAGATPPYYITASLTSSNTIPQLVMSQLFPSAASTTQGVTEDMDLHARAGYVTSYDFNIQHQLRPTSLIEVGYMGNEAQKLQGTVYVNQPTLPTSLSDTRSYAQRDPYPLLSPTFVQVADYEWSQYNAGYAKYEKRLSDGISISLAYTFAKEMDSGGQGGVGVGGGNAGQDQYNRRPDHELAINDVRHHFIGNYVWQLPIGKGRHFNVTRPVLDGIVGGWQVNGITTFESGMPYTIFTAGDIANVATGGQRANATGVPAELLNPRTNNLLGLNRAAYSIPAKFTFGNAGENTQPGFGINNWDFSAIKNFPISKLGEQSRLQVRFEFFNFFNHAQFNDPASTITTPATFGIVTSANSPRIGQIAVKLYW